MKSNQIGISTNIFDDPADMAGLVRHLSKSFTTVEIEMERDARRLFDEHPDLWAVQRRGLVKIKEEQGLFYSMHGPYLGADADLASQDKATRLAAVDYLSRYIDEAACLGIPFITFHPGFLESDEGGVAQFSFECLTRSLETMQRRAGECGVELLLENTGPDRPSYIVLNDEQQDELYGSIGVASTLDIVHFHAFHADLPEQDYWAKIERMLAHVRNAHFNDLRGSHHEHLPLGEGDFDYAAFIERISTLNYAGNFIIEERGGGFLPEAYVTAGKRYLDSVAARKD
jgi:sugar phosphate isomerase/epimerase